mgnify:CR=1 FL=1
MCTQCSHNDDFQVATAIFARFTLVISSKLSLLLTIGENTLRTSIYAEPVRWSQGALVQDEYLKKRHREIGMSLKTPESVWKLQQVLGAKAKGNPILRFYSPILRFYSLYDKLCRKDVLMFAWRRSRRSRAPI